MALPTMLPQDLLTARNGLRNGAHHPPPVQTKSTRKEGRKRKFFGWRRRAREAGRDHEQREAAEAVQAAERNQQRAAQRRAKAAALDRKTAARHRLHRNCLLWYHKQIKKGARILKQQKEKRAAEERRKCRRQQHEEMLQRAAERKRRRRERHNLTAAFAQCRHWRLGLKVLLLLGFFAAYLECAAAMPRGNVAAAAAGAGQRLIAGARRWKYWKRRVLHWIDTCASVEGHFPRWAVIRAFSNLQAVQRNQR